MKLIGLDVGTTSICGLLLDVEDGRILSVQTRPNSSAIAGRSPWESLQNPDAILETALGIIHGFLDAHGDIRGIGVAGQMHGILYVDKNGNAVSPLSTWEDGRGDQPFEDGTYASKVSQALGRPVSTGMGVVTHFFNRKNRLVPASAVSLCTIADYVAMKLSKTRAPVMDATNAASLGCFDPGIQDFRRKDLEGIGIDAGLFPAVRADYPALGEARPGVPVFPSLGDTQGSFLGSVRDSRNTVLVNVGTGSQVCLYVESWHDIAGIDLRPLPFGGFIGVGAALCGGRAYAVLREFFKSTVRLITGGDVEVPWDVMNAMDPSGPREPLVVDTRFSGTRLSPGVRGSVSGISLSNFTPQHLAAGMRDGIVSELHEFYQLFTDSERSRIGSLVGSGNAVRLNPALRLSFEKRFGMPLSVPSHREETSFGAALVAGVAAGLIPGRTEAGALICYSSP